jgi:hypothetical protein
MAAPFAGLCTTARRGVDMVKAGTIGRWREYHHIDAGKREESASTPVL